MDRSTARARSPAMNVVITGGAGFLGQRLARALLDRGTLVGPNGQATPIERLTLVDLSTPNAFGDPRVRALTGDISNRELIEQAIDGQASSVFHLAAVVSGQAEADFDLGMRINLDATREILERCRALRSSAAAGLRELGRRVRRTPARGGPRDDGRDAPDVVRRREGDGRTARQRLRPARVRSTAAPSGCRRSACGPVARTRPRRRSRAVCSASR